MDLSIIIVNYRSKAKLINCLDSISLKSETDINFEIIVVDNNSGDNLDFLVSRYQNLKLVVSPRNLGMGGGNNIGINQASGEFILVLNPDTVINSSAVVILMDYLKQHSEVGLVGPKLIYPNGSLQFSCMNLPSFFMPILRRTFLGDYFKEKRDHYMMQDFDHNSINSVGWLMGSCLMFRKKIILDSGEIFKPRFDDRYFMYFEDIDLARQLWFRGKKIIYNPLATVIHDHQRQSAKYPWYLALVSDRLVWHHINSWLKYFIKWGFKYKQYVKN